MVNLNKMKSNEMKNGVVSCIVELFQSVMELFRKYYVVEGFGVLLSRVVLSSRRKVIDPVRPQNHSHCQGPKSPGGSITYGWTGVCLLIFRKVPLLITKPCLFCLSVCS